MANIPGVNPFDSVGASAVAPVTVGLSNTLTYNPSAKQVLFVRNGSLASITVTLDGSDAPASVKVPGTGSTFDVTPGAVVNVAAGATMQIPLANFRAYLVGDVTLAVSLATDVTAWMVEV
ncbi:hypothetical protein D3C77_106040 [compost metagenome]